MNKKKAETFLLLATLGVFACFNMLWQGLELYFYGEVQPSIVDSIISGFVFWSFYYNIRNWLLKG